MKKAGFAALALFFSAAALMAQSGPAADTTGIQSDQGAQSQVSITNAAPVVLPAPLSKASASDDRLNGVTLFSCSGFYCYNRYTEIDSIYDWFGMSYETYETTYKNSLYAILLNSGYLTHGFYVGATLGVLTAVSKREGGYYDHDDNSSSTISLFGPRVAYYYGKKSSKVMPFAAFEFDLISSDFYSDNAMRIGGGVLLQPKPHLGISIGLDYVKFGDEEDATNIISILGLTGIIY
jgi:hypothetical protein